MKIIFILIAAISMSGCVGEKPSSKNAASNIICLQGVQYYKFKNGAGSTGYGYLAPVFDRKTLKVKTCQDLGIQ